MVHDYTFDEYARLVADRVAVQSGLPSDAAVFHAFYTYAGEGHLISMTCWCYDGLDAAAGRKGKGRKHRPTKHGKPSQPNEP